MPMDDDFSIYGSYANAEALFMYCMEQKRVSDMTKHAVLLSCILTTAEYSVHRYSLHFSQFSHDETNLLIRFLILKVVNLDVIAHMPVHCNG